MCYEISVLGTLRNCSFLRHHREQLVKRVNNCNTCRTFIDDSARFVGGVLRQMVWVQRADLFPQDFHSQQHGNESSWPNYFGTAEGSAYFQRFTEIYWRFKHLHA